MNRYKLEDLKRIYRVLHRNIKHETDLLDSDFFADLQRYLQKQARADDVDVSDHGAWDAWLGNEAVSCAVRIESREELE